MVYISPRAQLEVVCTMLVFIGLLLDAMVVVGALRENEPVWSSSLLVGAVPAAIGLTVAVVLSIKERRAYAARQIATREAGDTRTLRSISQAVAYLQMTNRFDADDATRAALLAHDLPIFAMMANVTIPAMDRDANLVLDWVEDGQPLHLYALALQAAISDTDLRAHLSGAELLNETLLNQRAANLRAANPSPFWTPDAS